MTEPRFEEAKSNVRVKTDVPTYHYLLFACVGLYCSFILHFYLPGPSVPLKVRNFSLENVRSLLQQTDCSVLKKEAEVAIEIRDYMSSKLRYQFEADILNERSIGEGGRCTAKKVNLVSN